MYISPLPCPRSISKSSGSKLPAGLDEGTAALDKFQTDRFLKRLAFCFVSLYFYHTMTGRIRFFFFARIRCAETIFSSRWRHVRP